MNFLTICCTSFRPNTLNFFANRWNLLNYIDKKFLRKMWLKFILKLIEFIFDFRSSFTELNLNTKKTIRRLGKPNLTIRQSLQSKSTQDEILQKLRIRRNYNFTSFLINKWNITSPLSIALEQICDLIFRCKHNGMKFYKWAYFQFI